MAKQPNVLVYEKPTVSRKGVHAKSKTSVSKSSANYKKPYKGQGRWKTYLKHQVEQVLKVVKEVVCVKIIPILQNAAMVVYKHKE